MQKTYTAKTTEQVDLFANAFAKTHGVKVFATHTDYHTDIGHKITLFYEAHAIVDGVSLPTQPKEVPQVAEGFTQSIGAQGTEAGAAWPDKFNADLVSIKWKVDDSFSKAAITDFKQIPDQVAWTYTRHNKNYVVKLNAGSIANVKAPKYRIYHA